MSLPFEEKVAIVTGGSKGIGRATALAFARQGASVVISDLDDEVGERTAEEARAEGAETFFVHTDVTSEKDVERLVEQAVRKFGRLDVAANVAGNVIGDSGGSGLHLKSIEGWDATTAVCLRAVFLCMKHELAHMVGHGGGAIVNVSSVAAELYAEGGGPAYAAAKAGVNQLTKFAAVEYGDRNIRLNCIAPGFTRTRDRLNMSEEDLAPMGATHPIGRMVEADEQADAILWLCSDSAAMVTGQVLSVDGGWSAL